MKIIGGKFKGRNFYMPSGIRPTQNVVRKALFDILGQDLTEQTVLELFAGSGAIGLEALSRGAEKVTFIEKDPRVAQILQENIALLVTDQGEPGYGPCEVLNIDAFAAIKHYHKRQRRFDLVYLDPPYGRELAKKALNLISACDIVHRHSRVVIEHQKKEILPEEEGRFLLKEHRKYGSSLLAIYEMDEQK